MEFDRFCEHVEETMLKAAKCDCPSCAEYVRTGKPQCAAMALHGLLFHALEEMFRRFNSNAVAMVSVAYRACNRAMELKLDRMEIEADRRRTKAKARR